MVYFYLLFVVRMLNTITFAYVWLCVTCTCMHDIAHAQLCSRPRVLVIIFLVHSWLTTDVTHGSHTTIRMYMFYILVWNRKH